MHQNEWNSIGMTHMIAGDNMLLATMRLENDFVATLPHRYADLLAHIEAKCPLMSDSTEVTLDMSQSLNRIHLTKDKLSTLTGRGEKWLRKRARPLCGIECLQAQGFNCSALEDTLATFPNRDLKDLAGNAFCAVSVAQLLTATFVCVQWLWGSTA